MKYNFISDLLSSENPSFFALSETWLPDSPGAAGAMATPKKFSLFHHNPRIDTRGGGVALICATKLTPKLLNIGTYPSFESLVVQIKNPQPSILAVIYRPDKNSTIKVFNDDFTDFLCKLSCLNKPILVMGDFNIHFNKPSQNLSHFKDTLEMFTLEQFVSSATHCHGNILDLVISSNTISSLEISNPYVSDHFLIKFKWSLPSPIKVTPASISVSYRKLDQIDTLSLNEDIVSLLPPCENLPSTPDAVLQLISNSLSSSLNNHAPLIERNVRFRPQSQWFSNELRSKKQHRRACERKLQKANQQNHPNLQEFQNNYREATHSYFRCMESTRQNHSRSLIENSGNKPKTLFNVANKLLSSSNLTEPFVSSNILSDFFVSKISDIRASITHGEVDELPPPDIPLLLKSLPFTSDEEVLKLLKSSNKTFSPLDPFPSKLISSISSTITPYLVKLFNCSFATGIFPKDFKHAFVKPLLKKPNLDPEKSSNYRPVSLLPFFSKLIERLVKTRINDHMSKFIKSETFQSGFKEFHSTETALLCVTNDLRLSADAGFVTFLILLDLSAAFDTLDHEILIERLMEFLGLREEALNWFKSYLENRSFQVQQGNDTAGSVPLDFGVPQGSVLGPLLFRIYILPLLVLLSNLNVSFHCYADDTQIYIPCKFSNIKSSVDSITSTYKLISDWLSNNYLKLNDNKSEIILIGTPNTVTQCKTVMSSLKLGTSDIEFSTSVKNLGIVFDENLSFVEHIKQCRKSSFFMLKNLGKIRNHFDKPSFEILIHAFISSKLDYCNSLFINLPNCTLNSLQAIQNYAARLVLKQGRFCHITPLLESLHWLPVPERIKFKVLLLTYRAIHLSEPLYLRSLLTLKSHTRSLRDQDHLQLEVPRSHSTRMGDRAFAVAAPLLWNTLPLNIREASSTDMFKSLLKTYLYKARFSS